MKIIEKVVALAGVVSGYIFRYGAVLLGMEDWAREWLYELRRRKGIE
jgi:hypothetical protein